MTKHRIFTTAFASVYPMYIQKVERKNRTKDEVDQIIRWLTGYNDQELKKQIEQEIDFETFFRLASVVRLTFRAESESEEKHKKFPS